MPLKKIKINELVKYLHAHYPDSMQTSYLGIFTVLRMKVLEVKKAGYGESEITLEVPEKNTSKANNRNAKIRFDDFLKNNSLSAMIGQLDKILLSPKSMSTASASKPESTQISPQSISATSYTSTSPTSTFLNGLVCIFGSVKIKNLIIQIIQNLTQFLMNLKIKDLESNLILKIY